jgi:hypothetical protein
VKALKAISKAIGYLGSGKEMPALTPQKAVSILYEKVTRYARSPAGNAGHFTPHAATWFNQARYLDDESEWQHVAETNRAQARLNSNLAALRRADAFDAENEKESDSQTTLQVWDLTRGGNRRFRTRRCTRRGLRGFQLPVSQTHSINSLLRSSKSMSRRSHRWEI